MHSDSMAQAQKIVFCSEYSVLQIDHVLLESVALRLKFA